MPAPEGGTNAAIEAILEQMRSHLNLEAEAELEILEEIRGHLEEAAAAARASGQNEADALDQVAAHFGIEDTGRALQATHAGQGTLNGIALAALPVLFALALRWMIFAPDGSAGGWRELPSGPALWVIVVAGLLVPLLRFPRRRYVLVLWAIFWGLSLVTALWPALRW
jgi:hypothetical protein